MLELKYIQYYVMHYVVIFYIHHVDVDADRRKQEIKYGSCCHLIPGYSRVHVKHHPYQVSLCARHILCMLTINNSANLVSAGIRSGRH